MGAGVKKGAEPNKYCKAGQARRERPRRLAEKGFYPFNWQLEVLHSKYGVLKSISAVKALFEQVC